VSAASEGPGKGSEFIIRLPLAAGEVRPLPLPSHPEPVSRRILLVEDNPDGRETLQLLLQVWGHRVDVAEDGKQGLQKALSRRPEVALVDIGLPEMDGYEMAQGVRAALGRQIFLIAMTGYGQPHDRWRAFEAGSTFTWSSRSIRRCCRNCFATSRRQLIATRRKSLAISLGVGVRVGADGTVAAVVAVRGKSAVGLAAGGTALGRRAPDRPAGGAGVGRPFLHRVAVFQQGGIAFRVFIHQAGRSVSAARLAGAVPRAATASGGPPPGCFGRLCACGVAPGGISSANTLFTTAARRLASAVSFLWP